MLISESGIYRIRNLVNNKFYIGSAVNLNKRKSQHFYYLRNNKHHNKPLQNSFNKYKKDNFIFEIMCYCHKEDLILNEQFYIDNYKPHYNICKVAGNCLGRKISEETLLKMKISHSNRNCKHIEETKQKIRLKALELKRQPSNEAREKAIRKIIKPILQYSIEGIFIKEYSSIKEAAISLEIHSTGIIYSAKGKRKTSGGYIWKYKN